MAAIRDTEVPGEIPDIEIEMYYCIQISYTWSRYDTCYSLRLYRTAMDVHRDLYACYPEAHRRYQDGNSCDSIPLIYHNKANGYCSIYFDDDRDEYSTWLCLHHCEYLKILLKQVVQYGTAETLEVQHMLRTCLMISHKRYEAHPNHLMLAQGYAKECHKLAWLLHDMSLQHDDKALFSEALALFHTALKIRCRLFRWRYFFFLQNEPKPRNILVSMYLDTIFELDMYECNIILPQDDYDEHETNLREEFTSEYMESCIDLAFCLYSRSARDAAEAVELLHNALILNKITEYSRVNYNYVASIKQAEDGGTDDNACAFWPLQRKARLKNMEIELDMIMKVLSSSNSQLSMLRIIIHRHATVEKSPKLESFGDYIAKAIELICAIWEI